MAIKQKHDDDDDDQTAYYKVNSTPELEPCTWHTHPIMCQTHDTFKGKVMIIRFGTLDMLILLVDLVTDRE